MTRRSLPLAALLASLLVSLSAQTLPPGVTKGASIGGITEYDFPNGLRVLLYPGRRRAEDHAST